MSLRVDEKRGGRSRSRSRQRSKDERASSPNATSSSKSKSKSKSKSVHIVDAEDDDRDRRSSRFDSYVQTEEITNDDAYQRATKPVIPGLSSLTTSARSPPALSLDNRQDDRYKPPKRDKLAEAAAQYEARAPRGFEMPTSPILQDDGLSMPSMPGGFSRPSDFGAPPPSSSQFHPRAASFAVPYPTEHPTLPKDRSYSYTPMPGGEYVHPSQYQYAPMPDAAYASKPLGGDPPSASTYDRRGPPLSPTSSTLRGPSYGQYSTQVREARPKDSEGGSSALTREVRLSKQSTTERVTERRAPSPSRADAKSLDTQLGLLSVAGGKPGSQSLANGAPPASPLLEAYRGTYQSISPMPSPMMLASDGPSDIPPLSPLAETRAVKESTETQRIVEIRAPTKKKVKIYDAEKDALAISEAMSHSKIDTEPLIAILPDLTHDQLLELRSEYKKHCKVQGRGVNIAKHIKVKVSGNFGKICYVTALGRWESEAYWANFWYQSQSSNRELLIEALMARTNADIREIKDSFRDKRYNDSLSKCMEKELKPDKFRTAVLMALEARRQEETDHLPQEACMRDVEVLHRALKSREGGETAIIQIVVTRSDSHLRDVLKAYEQMYRDNFARSALKKSNNLVGEVIAHILNGAINRPARDALLLRHALNDISSKNRSIELRYELLMSRLVRLHWDRLHLQRVKDEYKRKYNMELERAVKDATKGEFGDFCLNLCET